MYQTFSALADPTRFAIVDRLLKQGEKSAGELGALADISAPAISRHLKVLREAEIIRQDIRAQSRIYSINPDAMRKIGIWIEETRQFWDSSLDRLERAIEREVSK
ncbi:MAG: metalloregulator ArsR/SmtB family transcription factor [Pseudomonadota bacterium]